MKAENKDRESGGLCSRRRGPTLRSSNQLLPPKRRDATPCLRPHETVTSLNPRAWIDAGERSDL